MSTEYQSKVYDWLNSSGPSSDYAPSTASWTSSTNKKTFQEPSFPADIKGSASDEEEYDDTNYATWFSTREILKDIAELSEFPSGDGKLKQSHLVPRKPAPKVEEEPPPETYLPTWQNHEYISNKIQGNLNGNHKKASPRSTSAEEIRAKTASAWAAQPIGQQSRVINKGRGSLLIKSPENLENVFRATGCQKFQNENIQKFIQENQFSDPDESDAEDESVTRRNKVQNKPAASIKEKENNSPKKYVAPNRRHYNDRKTPPSSTGARPKTNVRMKTSLYVPPNRRGALPKEKPSSGAATSYTSQSESPTSRSNYDSASEKLSVKSQEIVEEKKPFSLISLTSIKKPPSIDVAARRNPTVLKLFGKKEDAPKDDHINEKSAPIFDSLTSKAKNDVIIETKPAVAKPFKPDQNPVLNAEILTSKLSQLQQERGEAEPIENEECNVSPDSYLNDFSSCSEAELEMEGDGYSSGFSEEGNNDYVPEENCKEFVLETTKVVPKLKCQTLSDSDDDDYRPPFQPTQPTYCPKSTYSCDNGWKAGVNLPRKEAQKSFNYKSEEFPKL